MQNNLFQGSQATTLVIPKPYQINLEAEALGMCYTLPRRKEEMNMSCMIGLKRKDYAILVSDSRETRMGVYNDEKRKILTGTNQDQTFIIGYTGLYTFGTEDIETIFQSCMEKQGDIVRNVEKELLRMEKMMYSEVLTNVHLLVAESGEIQYHSYDIQKGHVMERKLLSDTHIWSSGAPIGEIRIPENNTFEQDLVLLKKAVAIEILRDKQGISDRGIGGEIQCRAVSGDGKFLI